MAAITDSLTAPSGPPHLTRPNPVLLLSSRKPQTLPLRQVKKYSQRKQRSKPQSNVLCVLHCKGNCRVFSLTKVGSAMSTCSNCQGLLGAHHFQQQKCLWRSFQPDGWTLPIFVILFSCFEPRNPQFVSFTYGTDLPFDTYYLLPQLDTSTLLIFCA